jgi:Leucine-rich repeat (LRR) protein
LLYRFPFLISDAESIGGFPPEILELENLTHLDLSYQGVVSVPNEISNLTKLSSLILGPNPYLTTLPGAVGFLPLQSK